MNIFKSSLSCLALAAAAAVPASAVEHHPPAGELLSDDRSFTYRLLDEHLPIDPQLIQDVSSAAIARDLFEGLFNQDEAGRIVPGVATHHEVNEDNTVHTFHLRNDAKWSDGRPVTAHDFVFAWRRAADPDTASPYAWYVESMALLNAGEVISGELPPSELGVIAVDNLTLEVRLARSLPYFPAMTVHATTFPVPEWTIDEHGREWTEPGNMVSNGAYVLTEYTPAVRTVRERNHHYWNDEATIIERVVALVINDENVALTRYLSGELDMTQVPTGQYRNLKAKYPDQVHSVPRLCTYYYVFNLSESGPVAFRDVRVRRALSHAIDRQVITEGILQSGQIPAYTFTPGATAGFEVPDVEAAGMTQAERDAEAVKLMAEAGFGEDNPLEFMLLYNTSEGHRKIAIAASQMWKTKLGVEVTLRNMEWKTFLDAVHGQEFELARAGWCGDYNEASTFLDVLTTRSEANSGGYASEEVDRLMRDAGLSADPQPIYSEVERVLSEDSPIIPVYHYTGVFLLNPNLRNWPFGNVEQNWYSRNLYRIGN